MEDDSEQLRARALEGDKAALDDLVGSLIDDVYQIAVRMVWNRDDAQDATQEILTKVVTRLSSFEERSSFKTWVYRVAVNHLLDRRRRPYENLTFDALAADLIDGLADPHPQYQPELELLAQDVMVTCTGAMLLCLDRPHRVAYLLGDVLQLPGPTAADILEIDAAAYRKRLQRARTDIRRFMKDSCGLVSSSAACHCRRRVNRAIELGRIDVRSSTNSRRAEKAVDEIRTLQQTEHLMQSTLSGAPDDVLYCWRAILDASPTLMSER